jgi:hypothetical protein
MGKEGPSLFVVAENPFSGKVVSDSHGSHALGIFAISAATNAIA